tara:strand:+ start:74055 stop:75038 length:984 start_codon:yes stop_codon:yes gene_type:complete
MSKITTYNYEAWYVDYLEGTLSYKDRLAFEKFMQENPHLFEDDFTPEDWTSATLTPETSTIDKQNLKLPQEAEDLLIKKLENYLNLQEQGKVNLLIEKNPLLAKDWEYYKLTKATPNLSIQFKNKDRLKKKATVLPMWMQYAAAAVVALLIIFSAKFVFTPTQCYKPGRYALNLKISEPQKLAFKIKDNTALTQTKRKKNINKQIKSNGLHQNENAVKDKTKFEKLTPRKASFKYEVEAPQMAYQQLPQKTNSNRDYPNKFSLNEYIAYAFHKNVLDKEQTEFNDETLALVTEKIIPAQLDVEKQNNTQIISFQWGNFSIKRKKVLN